MLSLNFVEKKSANKDATTHSRKKSLQMKHIYIFARKKLEINGGQQQVRNTLDNSRQLGFS